MSGEIIAQLGLVIGLVLVAAMVCATGLRAWRGWLDLKRLELQQGRGASGGAGGEAADDTGARIELAAVKERLRRLEAIASGVEL